METQRVCVSVCVCGDSHNHHTLYVHQLSYPQILCHTMKNAVECLCDCEFVCLRNRASTSLSGASVLISRSKGVYLQLSSADFGGGWLSFSSAMQKSNTFFSLKPVEWRLTVLAFIKYGIVILCLHKVILFKLIWLGCTNTTTEEHFTFFFFYFEWRILLRLLCIYWIKNIKNVLIWVRYVYFPKVQHIKVVVHHFPCVTQHATSSLTLTLTLIGVCVFWQRPGWLRMSEAFLRVHDGPWGGVRCGGWGGAVRSGEMSLSSLQPVFRNQAGGLHSSSIFFPPFFPSPLLFLPPLELQHDTGSFQKARQHQSQGGELVFTLSAHSGVISHWFWGILLTRTGWSLFVLIYS